MTINMPHRVIEASGLIRCTPKARKIPHARTNPNMVRYRLLSRDPQLVLYRSRRYLSSRAFVLAIAVTALNSTPSPAQFIKSAQSSTLTPTSSNIHTGPTASAASSNDSEIVGAQTEQGGSSELIFTPLEARPLPAPTPARLVSLSVSQSSRNIPNQEPSRTFEAPTTLDETSASLVPQNEQGVAELSGRTVACQAACCFPLAKFLDQRAETIRNQSASRHHGSNDVACLESRFLRRQAQAQRDIAAGLALRAYYSWIANRDQLALVRLGQTELEQQSQVQERLIERGIALDDPTAIDRKRLELRDQEIQLLANDAQLAGAIQRMTCCAIDIRSSVVETLDVRNMNCACDGLIQYALAHRQDYLALVELCQCLDVDSARAIAGLLSPLAGGVNLQVLNCDWIAKLCLAAKSEELVAQVKRELRQAIEYQRQRIEQSVCDKCQAVSTAYQRLSVAEEIVASWQKRIAALNRLEELGDARGDSLIKAKSELLVARSTLLQRKLSARLAEVELAEAVGGLANRCCHGSAWLVCCEQP